MAKGQRALLPPEDEEQLKQISATGSDTLRQRAQAILAWHEGLTANEAAKRARLSVNQIQYLWKLYRRKGLDLFMVDSTPVPVPPAEASVTPAPEPPGLSTLEALCAQYGVDTVHARQVGALALQIFDATANVHRLPQNVRSLLEAAALVHNVAYGVDPPNHHLRGRDIVMANPLRGFTDDERRILACTTSFHRKRVRPEAEPVYLELPEELRRDALMLSAILRVADGLDHSQSQSTQIAQVEVTPEEVVLTVDGPHALEDAEQSQKKADLWNQVFPNRIRVAREMPQIGPPSPIVTPAISLPGAPQADNTMSVTRVGRTFALNTLERINALIRTIRTRDITVLPALAREAERLAEAVVLADAKDFRKETRWFLTALEEARFFYMMSERAVALSDETGDPAASMVADAIAVKAASWEVGARTAFNAIDLDRYNRLTHDLRLALTQDPDPNEKALAAFHAGPILWEDLTALRSVMEHGTSVNDALDNVRRLQDHLVAFRGFLGPEVAQVLDILSRLESYLAAIQVTQSILARLEVPPVKKVRGKKATPEPSDPALEALRQAQIETLERLADNLPDVWMGVNSPVFRRAFALAVAAP